MEEVDGIVAFEGVTMGLGDRTEEGRLATISTLAAVELMDRSVRHVTVWKNIGDGGNSIIFILIVLVLVICLDRLLFRIVIMGDRAERITVHVGVSMGLITDVARHILRDMVVHIVVLVRWIVNVMDDIDILNPTFLTDVAIGWADGSWRALAVILLDHSKNVTGNIRVLAKRIDKDDRSVIWVLTATPNATQAAVEGVALIINDISVGYYTIVVMDIEQQILKHKRLLHLVEQVEPWLAFSAFLASSVVCLEERVVARSRNSRHVWIILDDVPHERGYAYNLADQLVQADNDFFCDLAVFGSIYADNYSAPAIVFNADVLKNYSRSRIEIEKINNKSYK